SPTALPADASTKPIEPENEFLFFSFFIILSGCFHPPFLHRISLILLSQYTMRIMNLQAKQRPT
ncbi:MAG: hypothetical protein K2N34_07640, partial [Lachnospiraceae bacterium]|nr:hypothetical protein [Lachnospiraceae bacterium]